MEQADSVEDIYLARSIQTSLVPVDSNCDPAKTGIGTTRIEALYTMSSLNTRGSDGRVVNSNVQITGSGRACFSIQSATTLGFYSEGNLGDIEFGGAGTCTVLEGAIGHVNFPEPGLSPLHCWLNLTSLPPGYVGGQVTNNSMSSRNATGDVSNPPGYTQSSIITIRLWKQPQ
jgi:hypothetical protein